MSAAETAWTARRDGESEERFDVPHAWPVEDLPGDRARVPTQETRIGNPAAAPAQERLTPIRAASGKLEDRPHIRTPAES
ncbi:hypothetical protein [Streptomyces sp. SAI-127]|uniref:hypothetical protein n=1 Tax=Streptomyces sp. SAI-127 TaxID=2940543 RepID=UPI0024759345|nr:hypothetical protein [Streptomyces sp. SAI-127]MDH6492780.1 hypothetical protein [Streptomyces sp. SAI-127]